MLLGGAFMVLVALLLSGSRGGIMSTALGLFVLGALMLGRGRAGAAGQREALLFLALLVAATFLFFGDSFLGRFASEDGLYDRNRMAIYGITLGSILDAPLLGFGYGTFRDVFPLYRDRSIGVEGIWERAHNTYLEIFQGLGLVFGLMLVVSVILLAAMCLKGAAKRRQGATAPCVAAGAAFLVGVHALVDFSLQIQAVTLTFMALLGAGVAQSESSRLALND